MNDEAVLVYMSCPAVGGDGVIEVTIITATKPHLTSLDGAKKVKRAIRGGCDE